MPPAKLYPPPASLPPGSSVVAYLRDSGHAEQEMSVQQQQNSLAEWATQYKLHITRWYIDEARRGSTTIGRDALAQLMNALRKKEPIQGIVVWSYARFSRGVDEPALYRAEIRVLGYQFHSLIDDVPEGPIGRVFEAILDYKNHQHLADMSIEIQRGLYDLVKYHKCIPGTPPRGFKREKFDIGNHRDGTPRTGHRWIPDSETAPLILRAFEMRASGHSIRAIHKETALFKNNNGYTTMWTNRLYVGTLFYGDLVIENYCKPIVPLDIWEDVQKIQMNYQQRDQMTSAQLHPRRASSRYLLSGLVRCAICDSPLYGQTSTYSNKPPVYSYLCPNSRKHTCTNRRIPQAALEIAVINTIEDYLLDPRVHNENESHTALESLRRQQALEDDHDRVVKRLALTRRNITNVAEAISQYGHSKALLDQLSNLENEESDLFVRVNHIDQELAVNPLPISEKYLEEIKYTVQQIHELPNDEKRTILHGFIQVIRVKRDSDNLTGEIYYYPVPDSE